MSVGQNKKKLNRCYISMVLAAVLWVLVLFTTHLVSSFYAKYTSTDTVVDTARVAAFGRLSITEKIDGEIVALPTNTVKIVPGLGISKQVYADYSGSEMDTYIFIAVSAPNWNFSGDENRTFSYGSVESGTNDTKATEPLLKWVVHEYWNYLKYDDSVKEYVFYHEVSANTSFEGQDIIKIYEDVDNGADKYISVSEWATEAYINQIRSAANGLPELNFRGIVVQSSGFQSAEAAWGAVK